MRIGINHAEKRATRCRYSSQECIAIFQFPSAHSSIRIRHGSGKTPEEIGIIANAEGEVGNEQGVENGGGQVEAEENDPVPRVEKRSKS